MVVAVQKWRHYVVGKPFVIKTDQQSLKYLLDQRVGTPAQRRWITKLLGYNFLVEYKKGKENVLADACQDKGKSPWLFLLLICFLQRVMRVLRVQ